MKYVEYRDEYFPVFFKNDDDVDEEEMGFGLKDGYEEISAFGKRGMFA